MCPCTCLCASMHSDSVMHEQCLVGGGGEGVGDSY